LVAALASDGLAIGPKAETETETETETVNLDQAILDEMLTVITERYGWLGYAPVHEVRTAIARRLGADAASHVRFDRVVKDLDRQGRIVLQPINDMSKATKEELNASIPGYNVTWYYLEPAA